MEVKLRDVYQGWLDSNVGVIAVNALKISAVLALTAGVARLVFSQIHHPPQQVIDGCDGALLLSGSIAGGIVGGVGIPVIIIETAAVFFHCSMWCRNLRENGPLESYLLNPPPTSFVVVKT